MAVRLFENCYELKDIVLPSTLTQIDPYAFVDCTSLDYITIPPSVTVIGQDAFAWCTSLRSFFIPNAVTTVGDYAFCNCTKLNRVTIGSGVTSIGRDTFLRCNALYNVSCLATTPPEMLSEACFTDNTYSRTKLRVPESSIEAYQTTDWWNRFQTFLPLVDRDVNGDGEVNIVDITSLIDLLLGNGNYSLVEACADVDGNGIINIVDVTALIDYVLNH